MLTPRPIVRLAVCGGLALLLGALAGSDSLHGQPPPELKKLHVLLVIDTNTNIGQDVAVDQRTMENLLLGSIPKGRYDLEVLTGKKVTAENILGYYRTLKVDASEGMLFFYAGHGATDPKKGHYLPLQQGSVPHLLRSTLRETMEQKKSGLAVILTDCCSNRYPLKERKIIEPPSKADKLAPAVRCLFYQQRGLVDVTAATDQYAYGDSAEGGVFTRTMAKLLSGKVEDLTKDKSSFITWKEFFPRLQNDTENTFKSWATEQQRRMAATGSTEKIEQATQRPLAFHLPEGAAPGGQTFYAIVSLRNPGNDAVRYQWRWVGEMAWMNGTLAAKGGTAFHHLALASEAMELPKLEIKAEGENTTNKLGSGKAATATYEAGKKYKFEKSKTRGLEEEPPDKK